MKAGDLVKTKYRQASYSWPGISGDSIGIVVSRDGRAIKVWIDGRLKTSLVENWEVFDEN